MADGKCYYDKAKKCFCIKGSPLRGVHTVIKTLFCPNYSYADAKLGPDTDDKKQAKKSVLSFNRQSKQKIGIIVENQLKKIYDILQEHKQLSLKHFIKVEGTKNNYPKLPDSVNSGQVNRSQILNFRSRTLRESTSTVCRALVKRGYKLKYLQRAVGDLQELRVGTAADIVCEDAKGEEICIELKCGYSASFFKYVGPMEANFNWCDDSQYSQAMLQLCITAMLLWRKRSMLHRAYVIRVHSNEKGYSLYQLHEKFRSKAVIKDLVKYLAQTKKQTKANKPKPKK